MKKIFSEEKFCEWHKKTYDKLPPKGHWSEKCYGRTLEECVEKTGTFCDASIKTWFETVYEPGDYVKLKNKRGKGWNDHGFMDGYIGAVVRIEHFTGYSHRLFNAENAVNPWDGGFWAFHLEDIERPATAEEIEEYEKKRSKTNDNKKISVVITFDGLTTKAELIDSKTAETCKSAEAHCNPSDVYSRSEGARIAIERLFEKKK